MYAGLFLAPWMFVYGVSALAFHHWSWFSDWPRQAEVDLPPGQLTLPGMPDAGVLAQAAVAALNTVDGGGYTLESASTRLDPLITVPLRWQGGYGDALINLDRRTAIMTLYDPGIATRNFPRAVSPLFDAATAGKLQAEAAKLFLPVESTVAVGGDLQWPALQFIVRRGDARSAVRQNLANGTLAVSGTPSARWPTFLTGLHKTNWKFATGPWVRTAWAVIADSVAFALIFWATTGLIMWWHMKPVRIAGAVALAAALLTAAVVAIGMLRQLGG